MRGANWQQLLLRSLGFESCEERLALSAHQVADFWVQDFLVQQPEEQLDRIEMTLADVHELTGVLYARDIFGLDGTGQTVAVIDSGIAYDHYALGGGLGSDYRVVAGWDFTEENDADPYDDGPAGFHGTHVAGIIGSNYETHSGVATGVDLVGLRVFNDVGAGYFDWVENALQWVLDNLTTLENPITTVNLSIGTSWNSADVPSWSPLEDEFSQLREAGVFISVAAGNSFLTYNEPGLSYPAASPHVVPVASVTNSGELSSFSQRHDRVLAAPGQSITSTVPDFLFSGDGVPNDFGTASGTSMAAPYLAGASVLLREAMEFSGYEHVTQDMLYSHFIQTADLFFDTVTSQYYHRLNLQSALDAVMPEDDFGSSTFDAYWLGTVTDTYSLSGHVGRLDDVDVFRFTAGQTGIVSLQSTPSGQFMPDWDLMSEPGAKLDGNTLSFNVLAGQNYTVSLGTAGGIGHYDIDLELTGTMTDWGVVQFEQFTDESLSVPENWYQLTTTRGGMVTVEAFFSATAGEVQLELYNGDNQLVASGQSTGGYDRVDVIAVSGETLYLKVIGTNSDVDFRITNLLEVDGTRVDVFGTEANDTFSFSARTKLVVSVNDVDYELDRADVTAVHYHGRAGDDVIELTGGDGGESAVLQVGHVVVSGAGYGAHADGVETIRVFGGGGHDVATFYDSIGDDHFWGGSDHSHLTGNGFSSYVEGFEKVVARSTAGGHDEAVLDGSTGNDQFHAYATYSYLRGDGYYNVASGFDRVTAEAGAGGNDRAILYDSSGDERFYAWADHSYLTGNGFHNEARGFHRVDAYATAGGDDRAYLYDTDADDRFYGTENYGYLLGNGYRNMASGFDRVTAYASQGNDRAILYDSFGDDRFYGLSDYSLIMGSGFYHQADGFDKVHAYAIGGGDDQAYLYDSPQNDVFKAWSDYSYLSGAGFSNHAVNFAHVHAFASTGKTDYAVLYDTDGDDIFHGDPTMGSMRGSGYENIATGFDKVTASASAGNDTAHMYDSAGDNRFFGLPDYSVMTGDGLYLYAWGFNEVFAYATAGGNDQAYLFDSVGDDLLVIDNSFSRLAGTGFSNQVSGFGSVASQCHSGGVDQAIVYNVNVQNTFAVYGNDILYRQVDREDWMLGFENVTAHSLQGETVSAEVAALDMLLETLDNWNGD